MGRVAIVADSGSDLAPEVVEAHGIRVVPLFVAFADRQFRSGVDLSIDEFWDRMLAPEAPFPTTAAPPPGSFADAFGAAFAGGADAVVCITLGSRISATYQSAQVARQGFAEREIEVVDSMEASMGAGLQVLQAAEMAEAGLPAAEIAAALRAVAPRVELYAYLDTLEYLRKGGRISGTRAAVGSVLSVKPIITVRDGLVDILDKPRTRAKARERVLELLSATPAERMAVLHGRTPGVESFRDELVARLPGGIDPARVTITLLGPSIAPHVGPGVLGAVKIPPV